MDDARQHIDAEIDTEIDTGIDTCIPRRVQLPPRRMQITEAVVFADHHWLFAIGFDDDGRAREIFADGSKTGGAIEALVDDGCIMVSLLLQLGIPADRLVDHLSREGIDPAAPAASLFGLLALKAQEIERACGQGIRDAVMAAKRRVAPIGARPETADHG